MNHLVRTEPEILVEGERTEILLVVFSKDNFMEKITYADHKTKVFLPEI